MEIVPDPLLVALFLPPFLVAVGVMWFVLWKPLLAWMNERDAAAADAVAEATRLDAEVAQSLDTLEERLDTVRSELSEMRNKVRAEATAEERAIMAEARERAESKVDEATARISQEAEVARRGLADAAKNLSDDMATQVLGRPLEA